MLEIDIKAEVGALRLDVRLSVPAASLVLVGPNGAGKSMTLLHVLGIRRPGLGRVALGDRVLFDAAGRIDVPTEDRGFGYVPQHYALFPHLSVVANVEFALACKRHAGDRQERSRRERALAMLRELGVEHVANRATQGLSGGEAQRVALARALVTRPDALLLDEPFAALDASTRPAMREVLGKELRALGRPTIIVTHDVVDAEALADQVAVMEQGRIVQVGTLASLRKAPATDFVARFISNQVQAARS